MGAVKKLYDPSGYLNDENSESCSIVVENEDEIEFPEDLLEIQGYTNPRQQSQSGSNC
jgi:hypothetical protein